jgi:hypothetical protein
MRFTSRVEAVLRKAGWYPGRAIDIAIWRDSIAAHGITLSRAAEDALIEFGELRIDISGPGRDHALEPFVFDPAEPAENPEDLAEYATSLGYGLAPLGLFGYANHFMVQADSGAVILLAEDVVIMGSDLDRSIEAMVLGVRGRVVEIER